MASSTAPASTTNTTAATLSDLIDPKLQNVVATFNLGCRVDLDLLASQARNAEYNKKRFAAVVVRIRDPRTTALIFASGRVVVTGAKSEDDSKLASRKFARIVQKLGFQAKFREWKIQNIVGSCDSKMLIRLEGLHKAHRNFASYEPETFPGLVYKMYQQEGLTNKVVLLVFAKGKIVITGAKTRDQLYKTWRKMYPVLEQFQIRR